MSKVNAGTKHSSDPTIESPLTALSGRELDAAVAERVMCWTPVYGYSEDAEWNNPSGNTIFLAWDHPGELAIYRDGNRSRSERFAPSTDIAAAMEVVEKMRQSGEWCCITIKSDYHYVWWVSLTRAEGATSLNPEHKPTLAEQDESLPVAICRAALRAVAHNVTATPGS